MPRFVCEQTPEYHSQYSDEVREPFWLFETLGLMTVLAVKRIGVVGASDLKATRLHLWPSATIIPILQITQETPFRPIL